MLYLIWQRVSYAMRHTQVLSMYTKKRMRDWWATMMLLPMYACPTKAVTWAPVSTPAIADQSIGAVCLGGSQPGTYTGFPWDGGNTLRGAAGVIAVEQTTDPDTGLPVDGFAGYVGGGLQVHGCSQQQACLDTYCPDGYLAYFSGGKLREGRDQQLTVNIPPPGGLYNKITGSAGGVKAKGMVARCIDANGQVDVDTHTTADEYVLFSGNSCGVLFSADTSETGVAFSAVCANSAWATYRDDGTQLTQPKLCPNSHLMYVDLTNTSGEDQPYTTAGEGIYNLGPKKVLPKMNVTRNMEQWHGKVVNLKYKEHTGSLYDIENSQALLRYAVQHCKTLNTCGITYDAEGVGGDCSHFVAHTLSAGGYTVPGAGPGRSCPSGLTHSTSELQANFQRPGSGVQAIQNYQQTRRGDIAFLWARGTGGPYHSMILGETVRASNGQYCAAVYCHTQDRCNEELCSPDLVRPFFRVPVNTIGAKVSAIAD